VTHRLARTLVATVLLLGLRAEAVAQEDPPKPPPTVQQEDPPKPPPAQATAIGATTPSASVKDIEQAFARIRERLAAVRPAPEARRASGGSRTPASRPAPPAATQPLRIRLDWRVTLAWPGLDGTRSTGPDRIHLVWR
jgi:hypothetical protein